jgi:hypothetical protein
MENLIINGNHELFDVPTVHFNAETGLCTIEGESYLEKTAEFYDSLLVWLNQYMDEIKGAITFNFKLTYFNTSSSKRILYIMLKLKEYFDKGANVTTNWHYNPNDIEMEEAVEDFMSIAKLAVNLIPDSKLRFNPFDNKSTGSTKNES